MPAEVLTQPEVLKLLGISRTQLYKLRRQGKIEPIDQPIVAKGYFKLRFRRTDVEQLAMPRARAS